MSWRDMPPDDGPLGDDDSEDLFDAVEDVRDTLVTVVELLHAVHALLLRTAPSETSEGSG